MQSNQKDAQDNENSRDLALLRTNPAELILKHQDLIRKIVQEFIDRGVFEVAEEEDIIQSVNERLLEKGALMQREFHGSALPRTYLHGVVRNVCLALYRGEYRPTPYFTRENEPPGTPISSAARIHVERDVRRLRLMVMMYDRLRPRLLLCLKLHFRIVVSREDLGLWYPRLPRGAEERILRIFGSPFDEMTDADVFATVAPIISDIEGTTIPADSIRRWTRNRIDDVVRILNGDPPEARYDHDAIEALVRFFFDLSLLEG